jgi:hypothetical protein
MKIITAICHGRFGHKNSQKIDCDYLLIFFAGHEVSASRNEPFFIPVVIERFI